MQRLAARTPAIPDSCTALLGTHACSSGGLLGLLLKLGLVAAGAAAGYAALSKAGVVGGKEEEGQAAGGKGKAGDKSSKGGKDAKKK